jgi:hypothetical protein
MVSAKGHQQYVAWLPSKEVKIGRVIRIDGIEGNWKIVDAGSPRPDYVVEAFAENGRKGLPDGQGPSTPMRDAEAQYRKGSS